MTPRKFWRFVVLAGNGADTVTFKDLRLAEYAHGVDVTLPQHDRLKSHTFIGLSGDIGTRIYSGGVSNAVLSLTFEFLQPELVGWYAFNASGVTAPKSWRLEYSDDGATWHISHLEYRQQNWQIDEGRAFFAELYELTLDVQGSNAAPAHFVWIHDLDGELLTKKRVLNGESAFLMPSANPVCVTVAQEFGQVWRKKTYYRAGALVMPTNPILTPYYFRNRRAGISDLTEPAWQLDPEILTNDGSCVFELVERFNAPMTHAPLIPTRKL